MKEEELLFKLKNDEYILEIADDDIRSNKNFMAKAINEKPISFAFASDELQEDKELFLLAAKKDKKLVIYAGDLIQEEVKEAGGVDKWIKQQEEPSNKKRKPIDNKIEVDTDKQNEK